MWIANTILLLVLSAIFTSNIVLGNAAITKPMASVLSGLILSILIYFVPIIAKKVDLKLKDENMIVIAYFVVDFIALWIIKRFADFTGLGISSILFVFVLAVVAALIQMGVDKYSMRLLKKSRLVS